MSTSDSFLAIDLGASSGRAVVGTFDDGRMTMHEVHRFRTPVIEQNGHWYWDIDALWEDVQRALDEALHGAPRLRSVSIDSWGVDYVPLDANGQALRRPYSYRDPRTRGRLAKTLQRIDANALYATTGTQFLELNTLSQVVADIEEEPDVVSRTATRLFIADYLLFRLCGVMAVERTMASTTQLYDVSRRAWSAELIELIGDSSSRWPRVVDPGTTLGRVRADLLPIGATAPVVVASCAHDTAAAVAAVPASDDRSWAYISSGTWSLVGVELGAPILSERARLAGFTNEVGIDDTIRFLKNRTGTWILEECAREWDPAGTATDWAKLMRDAALVESPGFFVDCNAPVFAERGNMQAKIARACQAVGRPAPASRAELVRLVVESLADGYRQTVHELESLTGEAIDVLHVVGGGARNTLLDQLTADACGRRVIAGPAEATALGNLLVQARALGSLPDGLSLRDVARRSVQTNEFVPRAASPTRGHQPVFS